MARKQRNYNLNIAIALLLFLGIALVAGGVLFYVGQMARADDVAPEEMYYQGFYDACVVFMVRIQEVGREEALVNCDKVTRGASVGGLHQAAQEEPNAMKRWQRIWQTEDGIEPA